MLRKLLRQHRISQTELRESVQQRDGRRLSSAAMSLLITQGKFPRRTPRQEIEQQITAFFTERGIAVPDRLFGDETPGTAEVLEENTEEKVMLSQTARQFFDLSSDPFREDVQSSDDVFLADDQRYIREVMRYTAKHGGFLAVVGESGAGKSTLRRDLIDTATREAWNVVFIQPATIDKARLTANAICSSIVFDVSQERPKQKLEHLDRQATRVLTASLKAGNSHVLIIEEAHDLHYLTLKFLKRIYELEHGFQKLVSIILIGQPELKAKLDERQNWEAREVIRRCEIAELMPLNEKIEDYLQLKFARIGVPAAAIFESTAFGALRERLTVRGRGRSATVNGQDFISMSYPLVVNNLVTRCLNAAAELGQKIDDGIVREV